VGAVGASSSLRFNRTKERRLASWIAWPAETPPFPAHPFDPWALLLATSG